MANFNIKDKRAPKSPGPVGTEGKSSVLTGNGAAGFAYNDKSALFLLGVSSMFGQDKAYEKAKAADDRFITLVRACTQADKAWTLNFLTWLRASGNMRTSAVVGSIEAALSAKGSGRPGPSQVGISRRLASAGIGRLDEVGEAVAYYVSKYGNKKLPKPVKRGLADALVKLTNEHSATKYSSDKRAWSLGQLIQLLHPKPSAPWQDDLFKYLVSKDYGPVYVPERLTKTRLRNKLLAMPVERRRDALNPETLREAGMTWEALAGWLQSPMDAAAWEAIIPSMGYMALLRNLRNFDQAKIGNKSVAYVMAHLVDEEQVRKSRLFPFRFLAAYRNAPNARWAGPLGMALGTCLSNIPVLPGRTLVLVDTSGSMDMQFSEHSEMKRWDAAALFGIALGKAAEGIAGASVDVVSYSDSGGSYYGTRYVAEKPFKLTPGMDLLSELKHWNDGGFNIGGGTDTPGAIARNYRNHDRVIILTDEQTSFSARGTVDSTVPADKHLFTFNLAGDRAGHAPTGRFRHSFGGLTDACFPLISMIENSATGVWPWEMGR